MELASKPDFERCMERIEAWYNREILDRAPVGFSKRHGKKAAFPTKKWPTPKEAWFDPVYPVEKYLYRLEGSLLRGETFPVYSPNLGPNVFAACHGAPLVFGEETSWAEPIVHEAADVERIRFDKENAYFRQLVKMTEFALEHCEGRFLVGYTGILPGIDCAAAWRGSERFLTDFYDAPELVQTLLEKAEEHFLEFYDHFDAMLKTHGQPSVGWLPLPHFGRYHIPSADFSAMISQEMFREFGLPQIEREMETMTRNIYHIDGREAQRHTENILNLKNLHAVQWVSGEGAHASNLLWIPYIKGILAAGVPVWLSLRLCELEPFIAAFDSPRGLFLNIVEEEYDEQEAILKRIEKW